MAELDDAAVADAIDNKAKPADAVEHTGHMFEAALTHLTEFLAPDGILDDGIFKKEWGSRSIKREGERRQVHYLEVTDPNGVTMRIEVFFT